MFTLKIETDNAAFDDQNAFHEVARILRETAGKVESWEREGALYDVNGNRVGAFRLEVESDDDDES